MDSTILNIESIGCKEYNYNNETNIIIKYIPSLTYTKHKWFSTTSETIYIPLIFNKEEQIKELFEYYDNIVFRIEFIKYSNKEISSEYKLIELNNLEKLCINNKDFYREFNIEYIIKYKGHNILLRANSMFFSAFLLSPKSSINIFKLIKNKNDIINVIQNRYTELPIFMQYATWSTKEGGLKYFNSVKDAIKYIDELVNEENDYNAKLNSYYSVKSYKLVENS